MVSKGNDEQAIFDQVAFCDHSTGCHLCSIRGNGLSKLWADGAGRNFALLLWLYFGRDDDLRSKDVDAIQKFLGVLEGRELGPN